MNTIQRLVFMALAVICTSNVSAQSMQMAKYYYKQGKYLEAAQQLRPLADGGNAEAQCMAAGMFFEGKGVNKSDAQGVKYATLAADQGYEDAIIMLADYYAAKDPQKGVSLLKKSLEKFPKLKEGKVNDKYKAMMPKGANEMAKNSKGMPQFTGFAPSQVTKGDKFRLTYTVNTTDVAGFRVGDIPDAFEVLFGPSTSTSSSFQTINGETTQTSTITYTFTLVANKNGAFTIPAAHITTNGKEIQSNTLTITVTNASNSTAKNQVKSSSDITEADLFMTATIDKKNVQLGDSLTLTLKLYTLENITSVDRDGGTPNIDACYFKELSLGKERSFTLEQYNEKNYRTVVWQKFTVVPLKTGTIVIHPLKFNCIVSIKNEAIDPIDAFFNGGSANTEIKKSIYSPQLSFTVYE